MFLLSCGSFLDSKAEIDTDVFGEFSSMFTASVSIELDKSPLHRYEVEWLSLICLDLLNIGTICYDDACHLLKYAQNEKRVNLTDTMKKIGKTKIMVDKFHFGNHVDEWCKKHCNPYKCTDLNEVRNFHFGILYVR